MIRQLKTYQLVVDIALAVMFFVLFAFIQFDSSTWIGWIGAPLVGLAMAAALAVRRLSPALALLIAWAGAVLQMVFALSPLPSNIAIFGVLYVTAAYGRRAVYWAGFASAFVGALTIALYLVLMPYWARGIQWDAVSWRDIPLVGAAMAAALFALLLAWTAGALVRAVIRGRATRVAQELAEAETAAEQERVRIARDMHDVVAHSLAVVIAQADGARYAAAADPATATEALGTISTTARSALADVRLLLTQLRHSQAAGPQPTIADLEALYAQVRAAGVDLRVDVDPTPPGEPPASVQLAVYRILQEALTNALRHGDGGSVDVRLSWLLDRVDVEVRNGVGAPTRAAAGHGVIGMRERAQLVGGTLAASEDDGVFTVSATLPIGGAA